MTIEGKNEEVTSILRSLQLKQHGDDPKQCLSLLQKLNILGRQPQDADAIFTSEGIDTLCRFGLDRSSIEISRVALRCLANATLLRPHTRQIIVDHGQASRILTLYKNVDAFEDEFLCARLLLMLTDRTSLDFGALLAADGLAGAIIRAVEAHTPHSTSGHLEESQEGPSKDMALSETLKLLYSIVSHHLNEAYRFKSAIKSMVSILMHSVPNATRPLDPPINHLINALFRLDVTGDELRLLPELESIRLVRLLIKVLSDTINAYPESALDLNATPTLALLSALHVVGSEDVKMILRQTLLPRDEERNRPLGQADTLPAKLLRLSTSGQTPELREIIPIVLFDLSGRDPEAFVRNVGYGFASGFLTSNNISHLRQRPRPVEDSRTADDHINFVTGQYIANERAPSDSPMSETEKMQEAERLFVLFERLKRTGVMDVKNPVEEAIHSGRFEELD